MALEKLKAEMTGLCSNRGSDWAVLATLLLAGCGSGDGLGIDANSNGGTSGDHPVAGGGTGGSGNSTDLPATCSTKRGIAYAFDQNGASSDLGALLPAVTWFYDWGTSPSAAIKDSYAGLGVEFVPMIHDGHFNVEDAIQSIPAGAKYLLTFNEPNFGSQANLTPEAAAALWPQIEQIADARSLKIVSPALNYCGGDCNETDPFVWLDKFFAACTDCRIDYVAAHWYNCDVGELDHYLSSVRNYHRPIWLTEFACWFGPHQPYSEQQASQYAHDAAVYLDQQADVFRYSWFTGRTGDVPNASLLGGSGMLTDVGSSYVSAKSVDCP